MKTNAVIWFEIPVTDFGRAKKFYESVFGVKLMVHDMGAMKMAWFPMVKGAPGTVGALTKSKGYKPSRSGTVVYFDVPDVKKTLTRVKAKGGKTLESIPKPHPGSGRLRSRRALSLLLDNAL